LVNAVLIRKGVAARRNKEQGTKRQLAVWSWEFGVGSLELGVWSWEFGVGSERTPLESLEFAVGSLQLRVGSFQEQRTKSKEQGSKKLVIRNYESDDEYAGYFISACHRIGDL
jgi:hypothetical protein